MCLYVPRGHHWVWSCFPVPLLLHSEVGTGILPDSVGMSRPVLKAGGMKQNKSYKYNCSSINCG